MVPRPLLNATRIFYHTAHAFVKTLTIIFSLNHTLSCGRDNAAKQGETAASPVFCQSGSFIDFARASVDANLSSQRTPSNQCHVSSAFTMSPGSHQNSIVSGVHDVDPSG